MAFGNNMRPSKYYDDDRLASTVMDVVSAQFKNYYRYYLYSTHPLPIIGHYTVSSWAWVFDGLYYRRLPASYQKVHSEQYNLCEWRGYKMFATRRGDELPFIRITHKREFCISKRFPKLVAYLSTLGVRCLLNRKSVQLKWNSNNCRSFKHCDNVLEMRACFGSSYVSRNEHTHVLVRDSDRIGHTV